MRKQDVDAPSWCYEVIKLTLFLKTEKNIISFFFNTHLEMCLLKFLKNKISGIYAGEALI